MFNGKSKLFKIIIVLVAFIVIAISVNVIDKSNEDNDTPQSASDATDENEQTSFHVGIGHIVMLVILTSAYGIDRAIVYNNKLKEEKKYKEED